MAPASSPSPSKKRLITDPKPKSKPEPDPSAAPPNSAATSTASPGQPNLSDCHCCGYRINHTNPKDRLQLLDSIWRIVLLCRDCRKAIRFGRKCPYCFQEAGNSGNLFQCGTCRHKIHEDCVGNCRNWYKFVDEGFRVCVDCWVPEYLKNSFRVCDGSESSDGGSKDKGKGKRKQEKLGSVKERPPPKRARLCRNGVDLANVVLALPAMNYKDSGSGGMAESSNCDPDAVVTAKLNAGAAKSNNSEHGSRAKKLNNVEHGSRAENLDDGELAGELCSRATSSSPRTSRNKCKDVSSIKDWNGLTYKRYGSGRICLMGRERKSPQSDEEGLNSGLLPYKRDKKRNIWQLIDDANLSKPVPGPEMKIGLYSDDQNSECANVNRFGKEFVGYNRSRFKLKECKLNGRASVSCADVTVAYKDEEVLTSGNCDGNMECSRGIIEESNVASGSSNCDPDPYHFKYEKRMKGTSNPVTFLSKIEASFQGSTAKQT